MSIFNKSITGSFVHMKLICNKNFSLEKCEPVLTCIDLLQHCVSSLLTNHGCYDNGVFPSSVQTSEC